MATAALLAAFSVSACTAGQPAPSAPFAPAGCKTVETEIPRLQARYPNAHVAAILDGVDGAAVIHMFSLPNGSPLVADHVIIFVDDRWPPVLVVFFNKGCSIGGKVIPRGAVRGFISGRSFPDHGRYQDVAA